MTARGRTKSVAILGTRGVPAAYGGFETFAEELATRLIERGWQVTVFCEAGDGVGSDQYQGISLVYAKSPDLGPLSTLLYDFICLWKARREFDLVYMLGYAAAFECFLPRLWGTPVWINVDGIEWQRSKWNWAGKTWMRINEFLATKVANGLIADADGIKAHLQSRHRHMPRCEVIPYGAPVHDAHDQLLIDEYGLDKGRYAIVVARLEPENHILEIVKGYRQSAATDPLVVVGNIEPKTKYVESLLSEAEGDPRIRFLGGVYDKRKLLDLRLGAKAYFHGHSVGGTNPSLIEAMGCASVVIAHENVFNREVTAGNAFFFRTPEDIPDLIDQLDSQATEVAEMKKSCQDRVSQVYNWDRIADAYDALLSDLINASR